VPKRKLTKRRLSPSETPAEGRTRLKLERKGLVQRTSLQRVFTSFSNKLKSVSGANIKNGRIEIPPFTTLSKFDVSSKATMFNCHLFFKESPLGQARIGLGIRKGKKELVIEQIQGHTTFLGKYRDFKEVNQKAWNVSLVQSLIDTAYKSGFDRVLFRDIETSFDYEEPHVTRNGETVESVRRKMKALYTWTKKDCNFTKDQWIGPAHYWVREFP